MFWWLKDIKQYQYISMLWYIIALYIKLRYQRILAITFHYISFYLHQEQIMNDLQLDNKIQCTLNTNLTAKFCVRYSNSISGVGFKFVKNCYFNFYITNHFQQYSSYMAINFIDGRVPWEKLQTWSHSRTNFYHLSLSPGLLWC